MKVFFSWSGKRSKETRVGIICLTRENLDENWILFEAGALSKTKDAHVCTFLLDLKPTDVERPLGEFQHTKFEKEDVRKLLHTINGAVKKEGERALGEKQLDKIFERFWPELEKDLRTTANQGPETEEPTRSEADILEELVERVRAMDRRLRLEFEQMRHRPINIPAAIGSKPIPVSFDRGTDYTPLAERIAEQRVANLLADMINLLKSGSKEEEEQKKKKRTSTTPKKKAK